MEVWKNVKGFENYEVSSLGRVKRKASLVIYSNGNKCNHKEKMLKQENNRCNTKGCYKRVTLSKKNIAKRFLVHRLVATFFILNDLNKPCVNHIDGNPSNNAIENLEWCTYSENEKHSYGVLGKVNPIRKLKNYQIKDILDNCVKGKNQNNKGNVIDFMNKYQISRKTVLNVLNKKYYV